MVYVIICKRNKIYVGSTIRTLRERITEHFRALKQKGPKYHIRVHAMECVAQNVHSGFKFHGIDHIANDIRGDNRELKFRRCEAV